jgi:hypothetical protein
VTAIRYLLVMVGLAVAILIVGSTGGLDVAVLVVILWVLPVFVGYRIHVSKERDSPLVLSLLLGWLGVLIAVTLPPAGKPMPVLRRDGQERGRPVSLLWGRSSAAPADVTWEELEQAGELAGVEWEYVAGADACRVGLELHGRRFATLAEVYEHLPGFAENPACARAAVRVHGAPGQGSARPVP